MAPITNCQPVLVILIVDGVCFDNQYVRCIAQRTQE